MAEKKKCGFKKLEGKVEREYEKKGMSAKKSEEVGKKVAGKVKNEIRAKKK